jgi:hypothetical protein
MPKVFGSTASCAAVLAFLAEFLQALFDTSNAPIAPAADILRKSLLDCSFFIVKSYLFKM